MEKLIEKFRDNVHQTQPSEVYCDFQSGDFEVPHTSKAESIPEGNAPPLPMDRYQQKGFCQMLTPVDYFGKTHPKLWLRHYELVSEANLWKNDLKLCRVIGTLKGAAQLWYVNLRVSYEEKGRKLDWTGFKDELIMRFGNRFDGFMNTIDIMNTPMKKDDFDIYWEEKIGKIKMDTPEMSEKVIMNHMFDGLPQKLKLQVMDSFAFCRIETPSELHTIIKKLLDIEMYKDKNGAINQAKRELYNTSTFHESNAEYDPKKGVFTSKDNNWKLEKHIVDLTKVISDLVKIQTPKKEGETVQSSSKSDWLKTVECFNCHQMGHLSKYCPAKQNQGNEMERN